MATIPFITLVAVLFYIVIPGIGAFLVRHRWRVFRRRIVESSLFPFAGYSQMRRLGTEPQTGYQGCFRFIGTLEAIQGDDIIWLRRGNISIAAEMNRASLYMLPAYSAYEEEGRLEENEEALTDEIPRQLSWDRIFSLPEGTQVFISGPFYTEKGHGVFRSTDERTLTVMLFDGRDDTIIRRAIWGGRQRNEYWNLFTPGSLAAGAFALIVISYFLLRSPLLRGSALLSLSFSLIPVAPILPPGVLLYFLYRNLWKRARFLRAERDLLKLPLRYFGEDRDRTEVRLAGGELYARRNLAQEAAERFVDERVKVRTTMVSGKAIRAGTYAAFGTLRPTEEGEFIRKPEDPMAELLLIPGDPETLSLQCDRRARLLEICALTAFGASLLVNLYLILEALNRLLH